MGCYNTITLRCPSCDKEHYAQSKGGDCSLSDFTLSDAPMADVAYIIRDTFDCTCGHSFKIGCGCCQTAGLRAPYHPKEKLIQ